MDSKTSNIPLIIGAIVVLLVVGGAAYAFMQKEEGDMMGEEAMKDEMAEEKMGDEKMMDEEMDGGMEKKNDMGGADDMKDEGMMKSGSYESYSGEKLARAETGDVVLFFHAAWCPSCRGLSADIESHLSAIPEGTSILKVDYDTETELKKKYGVTYQHTLVQVSADGTMIKKWSGSPTLVSLVSQIH